MPRFILRTRGRPVLEGAADPALLDPTALALLCLVQLTPAGLDEAEALLRLTPDATPADGRRRIEAAVARLNQAAGAVLVSRRDGRLVADAALLGCDVALAALPAAGDPAFLAGFDLPESPEFGEWVAAIRPRVVLGVPAPPARRRLPVALAIAAAVVVTGLLLREPSSPPGFKAGDPVVLADLDNATGDTVFDRSLVTAVAIGLRQSGQLELLPAARISAALGRMGARPDTGLTLELARELAVRENVRYVIGLRIEPAGPAYRLQGVLADAESGTIVVESQARAETKGGTLAALDRILQELRAGLGERRAARRANTVPLPRVATPSLEALKAYGAGGAAWRARDYRTARELWLRALDLDTGFAMSMGALGAYYYLHHQPEQGRRYYDDALRRSTRLAPWEKLELEGNYAGWRGDTAVQFRAWRTLTEQHPSALTLANYGTSLMRARRGEEAIAALTRALQFDSTDAAVYINLASAANGLRRYRDAADYYRRANGLDSTVLRSANIGTEYGALLIRLGRTTEAETHYRSMLASPTLLNRLLGYRGLGYSALRDGHLDQAVGYFRQANEVAAQQHDHVSQSRGKIIEGLTLLLSGDGAAATRAFDQAIASATDVGDVGFLGLFGSGFGRAGRAGEIDRLLARASTIRDSASPADRAGLLLLQAERTLARGLSDSAIGLFRKVEGSTAGMAQVRRISALAQAGRLDEARQAFDPMLDNPPVQYETQFEWYWALVAMGDAAEKAGDQAAAIKYFKRLSDTWATGDSTAPILIHARARLAATR